jgi:hypothetical protein
MGIFPEREEIVVLSASFRGITLQSVRAVEAGMGDSSLNRSSRTHGKQSRAVRRSFLGKGAQTPGLHEEGQCLDRGAPTSRP